MDNSCNFHTFTPLSIISEAQTQINLQFDYYYNQGHLESENPRTNQKVELEQWITILASWANQKPVQHDLFTPGP